VRAPKRHICADLAVGVIVVIAKQWDHHTLRDGVEGAARPVGRRDYHWSLTPTGPGQDGDISLPFHYA